MFYMINYIHKRLIQPSGPMRFFYKIYVYHFIY